MSRKLAVITGTFNPTTNAHLALADIAKKTVGGECVVVFVPAKHSFLNSWKHMNDTEIISDERRLRMLEEAAKNRGFLCSDCEINGTVSGKTIDTLKYLSYFYGVKRENTYYVCGSDKLPELERWYQADELLSNYRFLVIQRNYDQIGDILKSSQFLMRHRNSFVIIHGYEENQDVSATAIRNVMKEGKIEAVKQSVPANVYRELERMCKYAV